MLRRRRGQFGLAATITVLLLGVLGTESALAGRYVMRNCTVPGHPSAPMYPWVVPESDVPEVTVVDSCGTGNGVTFALDNSRGMPGNAQARILLNRPTGLLSQVKFVKVVLWYAARLVGSGSPLRVQGVDLRADRAYAGISSAPPGSENLVGEQQLSPDTLTYYTGLLCAGAAPDQRCFGANGVPLMIRGMEVTLSEDLLPSVSPPRGTLLDGSSQAGIRTLAYAAFDQQSGLNKVEVLLDETVVASRDLTPRCSHSDFTVCPASDDDTLLIDTRAVPNGTYDLALRVQDAAGNVRVVHGERAVNVANEVAPESIKAVPYTIVATFKGSPATTLTVPYGRRVSLRGRLTQGSQPMAAGTPIEILERLARRGAREKSTRNVVTKADGSFSIGLATSRPSRTLRVAYRPAGGGEVISKPLNLRVRAASRIRASLRGRVIRFSGEVMSGPIPRGGTRVHMEGRSSGSAWTPFKRLRTDKMGRFAGTYRLRVRRPGVVLKIRAVVPSEVGYGYLKSRSRAVTLRVR